MHALDLVGYLASALVVLTFYMNDMMSLRMAALASNCAFLAYGVGLRLGPVVVLHGILLPLNCWRLTQAIRTKQKPAFFLFMCEVFLTIKSDKPTLFAGRAVEEGDGSETVA